MHHLSMPVSTRTDLCFHSSGCLHSHRHSQPSRMLPHRHLHLSASLTAGLLAAERGSNDQAQCLDVTGVDALLVGQHGPRGHERSYLMSKYTIQSQSQISRVKYMPRPRIATCAGLFGFQDLAIYTCFQHIHSMGQQGSRQTYLLQTWRTRCTSDVSYRTTAKVRAAGNRGGLPTEQACLFLPCPASTTGDLSWGRCPRIDENLCGVVRLWRRHNVGFICELF